MAYSEDFRRCAVKHVKQGMTWDKTTETFKINRTPLSRWLTKDKQGELSDPPRKKYQTRKIEEEPLKA